MTTAAAPIATHQLSKRFGRILAVDHLGLSVAAGEIVGFLGPNGAGKTTTIRTLMGFLNPTDGTAEIFGTSAAFDTQVRRRIGYLPGDFRADPGMTPMDLFKWFAQIRGNVDRKRIDELITRLDVEPHRKFGTLSKGNRQKVGLVQAFMHNPDVLILDEPTSGLDPLLQQRFLTLVREAAANGAGILFSSHIFPEVETVADRVVMIRKGQAIRTAAVADLLNEAPQHLELVYDAEVPNTLFANIPGVSAAEYSGHTVRITIDGAAANAMQRAAAHPGLLRVHSSSDDLEDLFISLYDSGKDK